MDIHSFCYVVYPIINHNKPFIRLLHLNYTQKSGIWNDREKVKKKNIYTFQLKDACTEGLVAFQKYGKHSGNWKTLKMFKDVMDIKINKQMQKY